jgi:phosphomannomutase
MAKEKSYAVSQLLNNLPARFTASDRLQSFPVEASQAILKKLSVSSETIADLLRSLNTKPLRMDQTDGLRVYLDNGEIVHFRPSGNAPELRCYVEADSQQRANELALVCLRLISEYSQQS